MTKIDSKIPEGPLAEKWTNYKLIKSSLTRQTNAVWTLSLLVPVLQVHLLPLHLAHWVSKC